MWGYGFERGLEVDVVRWVGCKMTKCDIGAELGFSPQFGDRDL